MWKNQDHQENKLSKRAVKSDIALSSNVSFIPILFLPKFPTWKVKQASREDRNAFKYEQKSRCIKILGKDTHRWVLPLGWIWNKTGSLLRALCKILRGSPGLPSKWPNSLPKPQWNEEKNDIWPYKHRKKLDFHFGFATWWAASWSPTWETLSPSSQAGQNIQDFNPLSSRTIPTHLPQRIHCGEQNPFVLQDGLQNPLCRGSSDNCTLGILSKPRAPFRGKQDPLLTSSGHGKWAGCASLPLPHVQGCAEADTGPQTGK